MATKRGKKIVPVHPTAKVPSRVTRRRELPASEFVFPEDRAYPVPDAYHATLALTALLRAAGRHGATPNFKKRARKVLSVVKKRFPGVYSGESDLVGKVRVLLRS